MLYFSKAVPSVYSMFVTILLRLQQTAVYFHKQCEPVSLHT